MILISNKIIKKTICTITAGVFFLTSVPAAPALAQQVYTPAPVAILPQPGTMVGPSAVYQPPVLKGIKVFPAQPFKFEFILDPGETPLSESEMQEQSDRLVKYFLASLTVPEDELWVNLSPYEQDRIIPDAFGVTEMGRDLLAEDYILKQLTASLMYPEEGIGQEFWERIRSEAQSRYGIGADEIPVDTFNKVWILPEMAEVYENPETNTAFVVESKLKVMLEEDYLAMQEGVQSSEFSVPAENTEHRTQNTKHKKPNTKQSTSTLASSVIKEIIIPAIEQEVNHGQHFTKLRQVYHSLILATWYKQKIQSSLLKQVYVDQNKTKGVDIADANEKQKIYDQYVEAYRTGVYNYVKEEYDPVNQQIVPRKYFSGGLELTNLRADAALLTTQNPNRLIGIDASGLMTIDLQVAPVDGVAARTIDFSGLDQDVVGKSLTQLYLSETRQQALRAYLLDGQFLENSAEDLERLNAIIGADDRYTDVIVEAGVGNAAWALAQAKKNQGKAFVLFDNDMDVAPIGTIRETIQNEALANVVMLHADFNLLRHLPSQSVDHFVMLNPVESMIKSFLNAHATQLARTLANNGQVIVRPNHPFNNDVSTHPVFNRPQINPLAEQARGSLFDLSANDYVAYDQGVNYFMMFTPKSDQQIISQWRDLGAAINDGRADVTLYPMVKRGKTMEYSFLDFWLKEQTRKEYSQFVLNNINVERLDDTISIEKNKVGIWYFEILKNAFDAALPKILLDPTYVAEIGFTIEWEGEDTLVFEFTDNGLGISEHDLREFMQQDEVYDKAKAYRALGQMGGSGIGSLLIAQRLRAFARHMDGLSITVDVETERLGEAYKKSLTLGEGGLEESKMSPVDATGRSGTRVRITFDGVRNQSTEALPNSWTWRSDQVGATDSSSLDNVEGMDDRMVQNIERFLEHSELTIENFMRKRRDTRPQLSREKMREFGIEDTRQFTQYLREKIIERRIEENNQHPQYDVERQWKAIKAVIDDYQGNWRDLNNVIKEERDRKRENYLVSYRDIFMSVWVPLQASSVGDNQSLKPKVKIKIQRAVDRHKEEFAESIRDFYAPFDGDDFYELVRDDTDAAALIIRVSDSAIDKMRTAVEAVYTAEGNAEYSSDDYGYRLLDDSDLTNILFTPKGKTWPKTSMKIGNDYDRWSFTVKKEGERIIVDLRSFKKDEFDRESFYMGSRWEWNGRSMQQAGNVNQEEIQKVLDSEQNAMVTIGNVGRHVDELGNVRGLVMPDGMFMGQIRSGLRKNVKNKSLTVSKLNGQVVYSFRGHRVLTKGNKSFIENHFVYRDGAMEKIDDFTLEDEVLERGEGVQNGEWNQQVAAKVEEVYASARPRVVTIKDVDYVHKGTRLTRTIKSPDGRTWSAENTRLGTKDLHHVDMRVRQDDNRDIWIDWLGYRINDVKDVEFSTGTRWKWVGNSWEYEGKLNVEAVQNVYDFPGDATVILENASDYVSDMGHARGLYLPNGELWKGNLNIGTTGVEYKLTIEKKNGTIRYYWRSRAPRVKNEDRIRTSRWVWLEGQQTLVDIDEQKRMAVEEKPQEDTPSVTGEDETNQSEEVRDIVYGLRALTQLQIDWPRGRKTFGEKAALDNLEADLNRNDVGRVVASLNMLVNNVRPDLRRSVRLQVNAIKWDFVQKGLIEETPDIVPPLYVAQERERVSVKNLLDARGQPKQTLVAIDERLKEFERKFGSGSAAQIRADFAEDFKNVRKDFLRKLSEESEDSIEEDIIEHAVILGLNQDDLIVLKAYQYYLQKGIHITTARVFKLYQNFSNGVAQFKTLEDFMGRLEGTLIPLLEDVYTITFMAEARATTLEESMLELLVSSGELESFINEISATTLKELLRGLVDITAADPDMIIRYFNDKGISLQNVMRDREDAGNVKMDKNKKHPVTIRHYESNYDVYFVANKKYIDTDKMATFSESIEAAIRKLLLSPENLNFRQQMGGIKRVKLRDHNSIYLRLYPDERKVLIVGMGHIDNFKEANGFNVTTEFRSYSSNIGFVDALNDLENIGYTPTRYEVDASALDENEWLGIDGQSTERRDFFLEALSTITDFNQDISSEEMSVVLTGLERNMSAQTRSIYVEHKQSDIYMNLMNDNSADWRNIEVPLAVGLLYWDNLIGDERDAFASKAVTDQFQAFLDHWAQRHSNLPRYDIPLLLNIVLSHATQDIERLNRFTEAIDITSKNFVSFEDQMLQDKMMALNAMLMSFHINYAFNVLEGDAPDLIAVKAHFAYAAQRMKQMMDPQMRSHLLQAVTAELIALTRNEKDGDYVEAVKNELSDSINQIGLAEISVMTADIFEKEADVKYSLLRQMFQFNTNFWTFRARPEVRPTDALLNFYGKYIQEKRRNFSIFRYSLADLRQRNENVIREKRENVERFYRDVLGLKGNIVDQLNPNILRQSGRTTTDSSAFSDGQLVDELQSLIKNGAMPFNTDLLNADDIMKAFLGRLSVNERFLQFNLTMPDVLVKLDMENGVSDNQRLRYKSFMRELARRSTENYVSEEFNDDFFGEEIFELKGDIGPQFFAMQMRGIMTPVTQGLITDGKLSEQQVDRFFGDLEKLIKGSYENPVILLGYMLAIKDYIKNLQTTSVSARYVAAIMLIMSTSFIGYHAGNIAFHDIDNLDDWLKRREDNTLDRYFTNQLQATKNLYGQIRAYFGQLEVLHNNLNAEWKNADLQRQKIIERALSQIDHFLELKDGITEDYENNTALSFLQAERGNSISETDIENYFDDLANGRNPGKYDIMDNQSPTAVISRFTNPFIEYMNNLSKIQGMQVQYDGLNALFSIVLQKMNDDLDAAGLTDSEGKSFKAIFEDYRERYPELDLQYPTEWEILDEEERNLIGQLAQMSNNELARVLYVLVEEGTIESMSFLLESDDIIRDFLNDMSESKEGFQHHMVTPVSYTQNHAQTVRDLQSKSNVSPDNLDIMNNFYKNALRYKTLVRTLAQRSVAEPGMPELIDNLMSSDFLQLENPGGFGNVFPYFNGIFNRTNEYIIGRSLDIDTLFTDVESGVRQFYKNPDTILGYVRDIKSYGEKLLERQTTDDHREVLGVLSAMMMYLLGNSNKGNVAINLTVDIEGKEFWQETLSEGRLASYMNINRDQVTGQFRTANQKLDQLRKLRNTFYDKWKGVSADGRARLNTGIAVVDHVDKLWESIQTDYSENMRLISMAANNTALIIEAQIKDFFDDPDNDHTAFHDYMRATVLMRNMEIQYFALNALLDVVHERVVSDVDAAGLDYRDQGLGVREQNIVGNEGRGTMDVERDVGGIDFNPQNLDLRTSTSGGSGIDIQIDPAELERLQNAPGFMPMIINIQPLQSLPLFLGLNEADIPDNEPRTVEANGTDLVARDEEVYDHIT